MKFLDWFRRSKDKKTVTKESNANKLSKYNENLQLQLIGLRIGLGMTQEEFAELTGAEPSVNVNWIKISKILQSANSRPF